MWHIQSSLFGLGQSAEIDIVLDGQDTRKTVEIKAENGKKDNLYVYYDGETVSGKVSICFNRILYSKYDETELRALLCFI